MPTNFHNIIAFGQDAEALVDTYGTTKVVTLNRPKALNALNLNMIDLLLPHYQVGSFYSIQSIQYFWFQKWKKDDDTQIVIMKGSGDKAFCAGGDIRGT